MEKLTNDEIATIITAIDRTGWTYESFKTVSALRDKLVAELQARMPKKED